MDGNEDTIGDFRFQVLDLNDAQMVSELELDTRISGIFEVAQRDAVFYRFSGQEGLYVYFASDFYLVVVINRGRFMMRQ